MTENVTINNNNTNNTNNNINTNNNNTITNTVNNNINNVNSNINNNNNNGSSNNNNNINNKEKIALSNSNVSRVESSSSVSYEHSDWNKVYNSEREKLLNINKEIQSIKRPSTTIVRVSQLDSARLDEEILDLLRSQFMKIFSFFKPNFIQRFQPEINAILKSIIFKLSIFNLGTTYGNQLQNLTFRNEKAFDPNRGSDQLTKLTLRQKWLSGLINIGGEWLWTRLNRYSIKEGWSERPSTDFRKRLWNLMNFLESSYKALSILNFLAFLYDGKYVTLVNRVLHMRLVYAHPTLSRNISFEYMNRLLVWHGFTEFILFIMPLINIDRIKSFLYRVLIKNSFGSNTSSSSASSSSSSLQQLQKQQLLIQQQQMVLSKCPICMNDPISIPYTSDCGHLFCYYCIKTSCMIDSSFTCPRCNTLISNIKRFSITNN
ncbi:hypothetical protein DICPUDRAFT_150983 [Dictyostelium purpureum]|uniref:RING-type E3 ubiquitin transferase (cysteine targeting) n=1 Tax=Dictyostelium purpureum TaxID=5786 RepID=F0ZHQ8_DICPU|nr:uncharacterized protein DICPUDRAFT_150983 [Dictyostelium purpureum]EGC36519.1 hypothetical protein DICPUDRAFT_150983 [Dictyostelium purpureum]|eukprot:XP_003286964.1 hypothetical protein DICPUDRAFT_150983 [Dictyostelium purpureum]